ncbi:MAG: T9SS type A sorting domain-containing protein, partial [Bacteroidota bacterium]
TKGSLHPWNDGEFTRRVLQAPSEVSTLSGNNIVTITDNAESNLFYQASPVLEANYQFVITRADGKIVGLDNEGSFDFASLDPGKYFIWGYAFYGDFLLQVGDELVGAVATACFTKSANFILVNKTIGSSVSGCRADGATVKTANNETLVYACVGDGIGDYVGFANRSIVNSAYRYILTDEANTILALPTENFVNFEQGTVTTYRVWGLAFVGDFTATIGSDISNSSLATDCFDLSDNFLTVIRSNTESTMVSTLSGEQEVIITDNAEALLQFDHSGMGLSDYVYFITDQGQQIRGISEDGSFDFAPLAPDKYLVWGYAYSGSILLQVGNHLSGAISDGCFEKSTNFVLIRKNVAALIPDDCLANAGTLSISANPVSLVGGQATVMATANGDLVLPPNYELIYVLTSGEDIVIRLFASLPMFMVNEPGLYTLHTLVAELNDISAPQYFEASGIIVGQTTGGEVLTMIEEQGVCADFDLLGAPVEVLPEQGCTADAGLLFANEVEVALQLFTIVSASHVVAPTVPLTYELTYLLVNAADGVLLQTGENPVFVVGEVGDYLLLTLVAETSNPNDANYFEVNTIVLGETTIDELAAALDPSGQCLAFDGIGAQVRVVDPTDAANLREAPVTTATPTGAASPIEWQLYPNPTSAMLHVQFGHFPFAEETMQLFISNLQGQIIQQQLVNWQDEQTIIRLSVEALPSGWYQLVTQQGEYRTAQAFYKQ